MGRFQKRWWVALGSEKSAPESAWGHYVNSWYNSQLPKGIVGTAASCSLFRTYIFSPIFPDVGVFCALPEDPFISNGNTRQQKKMALGDSLQIITIHAYGEYCQKLKQGFSLKHLVHFCRAHL